MEPEPQGDQDTGFSGRMAAGSKGASDKAELKQKQDEALKKGGQGAAATIESKVDQAAAKVGEAIKENEPLRSR